MQLRELQIQPPDSAEEFASLCRALFAEHWQDPQSNTRLLQAEPVINVYGKTADGAHWGVRCWGNEKLTQKKIAEIAALATQFQPTLTHCIIATTSAADAKLQQYARQLSEEQAKRGACSVHVYSWESIVDLLDQYPNVARRFYPELFSYEIFHCFFSFLIAKSRCIYHRNNSRLGFRIRVMTLPLCAR